MPMPTWLVALLISVALQIASYIIMPKVKAPKPDAVQDMDSPTAEAGRPMPVVFGTMTVKSPNCLWWGEKTKYSFQVDA